MRIALLGCKGIPAATSFGGGVESYVEQLAVRLRDRGHEVVVYVRPYANPHRKTSFSGVRLITLPSIRTKHLDTITHTLLSSGHVLGQDVDIVHYHGVGPSTLSWIPRLLKPRAKTVATFHSRDQFHGKWGPLAKAYLAFGEWASLAFPHATTTPSHTIKVFCEKMYGRSPEHIPNAVEVPMAHPGSDHLAAFGLVPGEYFFTLARLIPHKAIDEAVDAFRNVRTRKKLVVIGEGSPDQARYVAKLHEQAKRDPRIVMVGRQTGAALKQLIANGYAMVHPSHSEGLSVAILEAMSYGKVVVMSDIPENLELMEDSGIPFPVGKVAELARAVQWCEDRPELVAARGARALETIRRSYSWDAVVGRMERFYQSLLV